MMSDRTDQSRGESPSGEISSSPADPAGGPTPSAARSTGVPWLALLGGALIASLISFGIGEATYDLYRWNDARDVIAAHGDEINRLGPYERNAFITSKMKSARTVVESRRAAISFGALGAMLGLALGIVGGRVSAGERQALRGGLAGLLLGGGAGALAAVLAVPLFYRFLDPGGSLTVPIVAYSGVLVPLAATCGLAFGVAVGSRQALGSSILGAVTGAAVAVVVLVMANSLAFPLDQEPALVPVVRLARLVIHATTALAVALFVALALGRAGETGRAISR